MNNLSKVLIFSHNFYRAPEWGEDQIKRYFFLPRPLFCEIFLHSKDRNLYATAIVPVVTEMQIQT